MKKEELLQKYKGKSVYELPTPCIIADIEMLEANLQKMDDFLNGTNCKLRPHFKSNKCVSLARLQISYKNTVGITCAKLSEAEQLVAGGVHDVLIANQVIGMDKTARIAEMNRTATVRVAVDSKIGIEQLGTAAQDAGVVIGVLVEVDIGMKRGGVLPGKPVYDLVDIIAHTKGVSFDGLQSYEGHIVTLENYSERKRRVEQDLEPVIETKKQLENLGYQPIISSGGTGTYDITGHIDGIDELQCGSYALMDSAYKKIRPEFEYARYILATVTSNQMDNKTIDVGLKGVGAEYGIPEVIGYPDAHALGFSEEHLVIENLNTSIGDKIKMIPPHGCTTNNLYSKMWIARNDKIVDVWEIEGRGCLE